MNKKILSLGLLGLLFFTTAFWAHTMSAEASYDGFSGNDCQQHRAYVEATYRALNEGKPPIELWGDHCCLGSPIFRMYQYLPHLVAAGLMKFFGWGASRAMHFLICFFWILQLPLAFFASRILKAPISYGVAVALLSPLISSTGLGGQSLGTYAAMGIGMFAQALGSPWLYLTIALSLVLTGWNGSLTEAKKGQSLFLGVALGVMFHFHHYMGFLGVLAYAVLAVSALIFSFVTWRVFLAQTFLTATVFVLMSAHQFYSMWQDSPLVFQNTWARPELWEGLGLAQFWYAIVNGDLLDFKRVQVIGALLFIGLCRGLLSDGPRFVKGLSLVMISAAFFLVGPQTFSKTAGDFFRFLQPERFMVLFQICAVFIAGYGLCQLIETASASTTKPAIVRWLAPVFVLMLVVTATKERLYHAAESGRGLISQSEMNNTLDPLLVQALGDPTERKRYWSDQHWAMNRWGKIPFQTIFSELGFPHVTLAEHSMSYGTEMTQQFDPQIRSHYSIFNVNRLVTYQSDDRWMNQVMAGPPLPDFTQTLYKKYNVVISEGPGDGLWALATIPSVTYTDTPLQFRDRIGDWLRKAGASEYPSIVPHHIARRWPWAVPSASSGALEGGQIVSQESYKDGYSKAVFESPDNQHYAIFKMSFHPHWRFNVNGREEKPVWVGPAYAAVKLGAGNSTVSIQFQEDPVRVAMFYLCWAVPLILGMGALLHRMRRMRLKPALAPAELF